jgi:hypothetical protein
MACTGLESGTLVSFAYIPEATCGITPTLTSVATVASDKTGTVFKFTRASGSWVADGFVVEMYIIVAGFTAPANNGYWKIIGVTSTDLTVYDPDNVGVTEVSGGGKTAAISFGTLRLTSPRSLMTERESLESDEVRPSRQVTDIRHGFSNITGSLGFELSLGSHTTLISTALGGTWTKPAVGGAPNLAIAAATPTAGKARITRAAGSFLTEGFRLGDVINTTLFVAGANNKQWQILAVTATTIDLADPGAVAVTAASAAGPTITFAGWRMDSRTTLRTLTIERRFNGIGYYDVFKGVTVNEFSVDVAPKEITTGATTMLGMTSTAKTASSIATTGLASAPLTGPMTAFTAGIYEGGTQQAYMTALNLTLNNNRTTEGVIGSAFSPAIFEGRARVTGSATFFLADATMANKFYNETSSSITLRLQDPTTATEFVAITIPKVKYMSDNIDPPQEGPVPVSMDFVGLGTTVVDPSGATVETSFTIQVSTL